MQPIPATGWPRLDAPEAYVVSLTLHMLHTAEMLQIKPSDCPQWSAISSPSCLKQLVELSVLFYLNPQPRLDPRKNQNGTMAEDALLMEKFISAECVR